MSSRWGRAVVASRGMRAFYGALKAVTFAWVLLIQPWPHLDAASWALWSAPIETATTALVLASVAICLVRGIPVVWEFVADQRVFAKGDGDGGLEATRGPDRPERMAAQGRAGL
jgi:hypothetical protein